ncbi:MAG: HlyD family efflux transporter periplasmic adaptor subunit [Hungatella sp.]|nr:HlyD family efflux transporter periplasmic adaptor subunit [Hungatella sp.]
MAEISEKEKKKKKRGRGRKGKAVRTLAVVAVIAGAAGGFWQYSKKASAPAGDMTEQKTATVQRGSITSSLSSSGSLAPKDTYNITSLVSGDVITADFEEGDQVTEGQVLYVIDASSVETELNTAQNSVERAQTSYDLAVEDYNQAVADYSGNTYKSTEAGFIKTLYVKEGDKVSGGTRLADIYNDQVMKLKAPFLSGDAAMIGVGNEAVITMSDTGEQLGGVVTGVSSMEGTMTGGRLVRYVTVEVTNPGGLTQESSATVQIGEFVCAQESTFEPTLDTVMSADISGSVEIAAVLVNEGDYVGKGSPFFRMTDKTAENLIRTFKNSMDQAKESLESSQTRLTTTQDSYENYTITAPISGTVITKNTKAGDKISTGGGSAVTLAVIYDLSELTFEMSVDELDVHSVAVGQSVEITADAFEGEMFSGKVTNISLASAYSNGVTNYPVTVTLDETKDLLPGMNVDGNIILAHADDVLVIPVDALMRGNRVYVKDTSVTESNGSVPAGFRSVEVETGLMNDDYVEILSGLSEGDEVYVSQSSQSSGMNMMPGGMGGGMGGPGGGGAPGGGGGGAPGGGGGRPGGGGR